ncbi:MAG TPA: hypothetical protein PLV58_05545 [Campylobacterales bacterium]|nr:hypothetical protein [Campylobacterales bacterium]
MKIKEIDEILGVAPATFNDWKHASHDKYNLAKLLAALPASIAIEYIKKADAIAQSKPIMLLSTVNCSISDKSKHLKASQIKAILSGKLPDTPLEKYALKIIKTEASQIEIEQFASYYKIPKLKLLKTLND